VAGGGPGLEPERLVADDLHVLGRDRQELAPEPVEIVAVEPPDARFQARRVDQVGCPDVAHVYLKAWILPYEGAGSAGVIQVDVRQQQVAEILESEAVRTQAGLERAETGARPAVDQRRLVAWKEIRRDDPRAPQVVQVDQERRQPS
jgi:hypothetical protein